MGALRRKLTRAGLPGLVVTHLPDLRYLCGFTGSSAALAVTRRTAQLFHGWALYGAGRGRDEGGAGTDCTGAPAVAAAQWLAAQPGVAMAGFDPTRTTVAELARWKTGAAQRLAARILPGHTRAVRGDPALG